MQIWQNITLGRYYQAPSSIHSLDPRAKLISVMVFVTTLMLAHSWLTLIILSIFLGAAVLLARIPLRFYIDNLRAFHWLFAITIILHSLNNSAPPHFEIWKVLISGPGIIIGLQYATRLMIMVFTAALFSYTTLPTDLTDGIEKLLRPLQRVKFPVHEFALMTSLALRFVPVIIEEAGSILRAQTSRGARFDGGLIQRINAIVPIVLPLLVATFKRADELALAMEARCYQSDHNRVSYHKLIFSFRDYVAVILTFITSILTLYLVL